MLVLLWAVLSGIFCYLLSLLPPEIVAAVNSWNPFGDNPEWAAVYWEGTALAYAVIYAGCVIARKKMTISLVDFTVWLLSLIISPLLIHAFHPAPSPSAVIVTVYLVPILFCVAGHYATASLRRRIVKNNSAVSNGTDER